jgi:hypothetical protein
VLAADAGLAVVLLSVILRSRLVLGHRPNLLGVVPPLGGSGKTAQGSYRARRVRAKSGVV